MQQSATCRPCRALSLARGSGRGARMEFIGLRGAQAGLRHCYENRISEGESAESRGVGGNALEIAAAPGISWPKGGGAIRGLSEKFESTRLPAGVVSNPCTPFRFAGSFSPQV